MKNNNITFKHFIWDFDGTLFDTYPHTLRACYKALEECGVQVVDDELEKAVFVSLKYTFDYFKDRIEPELLYERYKVIVSSEKLDDSSPMNGANDILEQIQSMEGYNYIFTHRDRLSTYEYLNRYNMAHLFRHIVTIDDNFARKPNPEAINYLIDKYHMKLEETLMIGDRKLDIDSGKNATISTCQLLNNKYVPKENADYYISNLSDILQIIDIF